MSNDHFVERSSTGLFKQVKSALAGIIFGPLLVIGAVVLLWWNEGRSAKTAQALDQGQKEVISIPADAVDAKNDQKLVYLTGMATTTETLSDDQFGVSKNALKLRRATKMYQWKEKESKHTEKNLGGGKTTTTEYDYSKVWEDDFIDSSRFKHQEGHENPSSLRYPSKTIVAQNAKLGAFGFSQELVEKIDSEAALSVDGKKDSEDEDAEPSSDRKVYEGGYYLGTNPQSPAIGDIQVKFFYVAPTTVSVVGAQVSSNITTYTAKNGTPIGLVKAGVHTSDALFDSARSENSVLTWIFRVLGFFLAMVGFAMAMSIVSVIAGVIPFLGTVVEFGTGIVAFVGALLVSSITIAIAWFAYRPMAAGVLLAIVAGIVTLILRRKKAAAA